jgi:8-oxo-dGTP diphosphatase
VPRGAADLSTGASAARITVVAGALLDGAGQVLIAERPAGKHMAGRWEFPGGKVAPGESVEAALERELAEELGISVRAPRFVMTLTHAYPDRHVELIFFTIRDFDGTPRGLDGQRLRWVPIAQLHQADILEADLPFIHALQQDGAGAR